VVHIQNKNVKIIVLMLIVGIFSGVLFFMISVVQPSYTITTPFFNETNDDCYRLKIEYQDSILDNLTRVNKIKFASPMTELVQKSHETYQNWMVFEDGILPKYILYRTDNTRISK